MKKILTASLVAMMAVTAANADIASTKYVNTQSGLPESQATFNATDFEGAAAGKLNLKDAVNAIATKVAGLTEGGEGSVSSQIENAIGTLADGATDVATAISNAQEAAADDATSKANAAQAAAEAKVTELANGQVKTNKEAIETLNGTGEGSVSKAVADAKSDLQGKIDAINSETDGILKKAKDYADQAEADAISAAASDATTKANAAQAAAEAKVTELANGQVKTNKEAIATLNGTGAGSVSKAVADVKSDLEAQIGALGNSNSDNQDAIEQLGLNLEKAVSDAAADATSKANAAQAAAEATAAADATSKANAAQAAAEAKVTELANGQVKTNKEAIATLNGTGAGSVSKAVADAISTAAGDATTKANAAQAAAEATAAADATSKADKALADAKSDAAATYQVKSSKMSIGGANGTWTDLTSTEVGYNAQGTYSLVLKNGSIKWEEVKY